MINLQSLWILLMMRNFKNILDELENKTAELSSRTHRPIADYKVVTHSPVTVCPNRQLLKCVSHTQRALEQISGAVTSATASKTDLNKCLLAQYESQLGEVKAQLSLISRDVNSLEPEDEDLSKLEDEVYKFHFDLPQAPPLTSW